MPFGSLTARASVGSRRHSLSLQLRIGAQGSFAMRITIIANITTGCIAVINRGVVVAGDVMGTVLRSLMSCHLRAVPKRLRHPSKPKRAAAAAPWQATGAAALPSYPSGSSQRPSTCGVLACPSGTF